MTEYSLFKELQKRKVVQAAVIYVAVAWGVTEIAVTIVEQLFLPQWVSTIAVIGFVVGFPVAMFLAWTFDLTADGIQRTTVSSRRGRVSIASSIFLLIAGTVGLFLLIRPVLDGQPTAPSLTIPPNSIAILPFDNASLVPDDAYLSAGFSDELRDQLGSVSGLRVAARSSSIVVVRESADAKTASQRLGVALVVEGSVRRRRNGMRISVQLIEGKSGLALWSQTFDRSPQELLYVQQEIADQIVQLVLPDAPSSVAQTPTRNAPAHELMLLARYYEQKVRDNAIVDEEMLLESIRLYREATKADPESALAQSRLAGALVYLGDLDGAEAPIFAALSLNPNLSEVQATMGVYYMARGQPGGLAALRRAVELNPYNVDALGAYAYLYWMQGTSDGPGDLYRRALELDPLSLSRYAALGEFLGKNTRLDEVEDIRNRVQNLFEGPDAYRLIGDLHEYTRSLDETIAWTIKARDLEPDNPDHRERLADLYAQIGDFETARQLQDTVSFGLLFRTRQYAAVIEDGEFLMIEEPEDVLVRYMLAFAYNATGKFGQSIRLLNMSGIPEANMTELTRAIDGEAFVFLANAVYGVGEIDLAQEMANFWLRGGANIVTMDWYDSAYNSCALAMLGRDNEALEKFELINESPRIPWESITRDSTCFVRFADNPRYQAVLENADSRREEIRNRLPATLERHGVTLFD